MVDMLPAQRQNAILDILENSVIESVRDLAEKLNVAESTIRRDLNQLESKGEIKRTYGGALLSKDEDVFDTLNDRKILHRGEKEKIGKTAADLISIGDTVFIDGGTTTECIASNLVDRKGITVVTCGLNIATKLSTNAEVNTILIGGELHVPSQSFVGVLAQSALELYGLRFNKTFISASGISSKNGITNRTLERIPMKRKVIELAQESILVVDGSKIGNDSGWNVIPLSSIDILITDESISPNEKEAITAKGVSIIIA
jgi:DeoR family fructose operon transcriptional repressor